MTNIADERKRLLIKVCNFYYIDGLNQQEISDKLGISRPQISRMLSQAKTEGIVNITIKNPYSEEEKYEKELIKTFGIQAAVVIDTAEAKQEEVNRCLGDSATVLLESMLKDNSVLGIMAGISMNSVSEEMVYFQRKNLSIVPLVGGWGPDGERWQANLNVSNIGEKLRCKYLQLNAPAFVASKKTRDALLEEPIISDVLDVARNSTVALVGIGQISENATIMRAGFFDNCEFNELKKNGAVASLCNSFINERGECIDFTASSRMIGITAEELKKITQVIAIASGDEKISAITAVLRGGWIDVLITNLSTAKEILKWHKLNPAK